MDNAESILVIKNIWLINLKPRLAYFDRLPSLLSKIEETAPSYNKWKARPPDLFWVFSFDKSKTLVFRPDTLGIYQAYGFKDKLLSYSESINNYLKKDFEVLWKDNLIASTYAEPLQMALKSFFILPLKLTREQTRERFITKYFKGTATSIRSEFTDLDSAIIFEGAGKDKEWLHAELGPVTPEEAIERAGISQDHHIAEWPDKKQREERVKKIRDRCGISGVFCSVEIRRTLQGLNGEAPQMLAECAQSTWQVAQKLILGSGDWR